MTRAMRSRVALGLATPVLLLGLAEAALRAAGFRFNPTQNDLRFVIGGALLELIEEPNGILERHPPRIWTLRPGGRREELGIVYEINPQGFPGPAILDPKPANGLRVLCLGDSSTFGLRCDPERTFSRVLESALARALPERRVEVVNGGIIGYTIAQGLQRLRELAPDLRPDAVVLQFGAVNEQFPAVKFDDEEWIRILGTGSPGNPWVASSRILQAVMKLRARVRGPFVQGNLDDLLRRGFRYLDEAGEPRFGRRVPIERFESLLEETCATAESFGARALVVAPPLPPARPRIVIGDRNLFREDLYARILDACRAVGSELGRRYVDAPSLFADSAEPLFADTVHPNEPGHARIAEALARALLEER